MTKNKATDINIQWWTTPTSMKYPGYFIAHIILIYLIRMHGRKFFRFILGIQCFKFLKQGTSTRQKALVSRWIQVSFWFWNSCRQEQRVTLRKGNSAKMLTNLYWLTTWTVNNLVIQIGTCTTLIFSQNKIRCLAYQKAKENLTVWLYKPRKTLSK